MEESAVKRLVGETARALEETFVEAEEDRPEKILSTYPNPRQVIRGLRLLIDALFPGRNLSDIPFAGNLNVFLESCLAQAAAVLAPEIEKAIPFRWLGEAARSEGQVKDCDPHEEAWRIIGAFFGRFGEIRTALIDDVRAAYTGDPAALTFAEVKLAYPGVLAITSHRLAHELYLLNVPIVPRMMSEWTHTQTGADIHPGARIGRGFFIDHTTGVVVGETARIGNRVKLYGGVTIGAKSFPLDEHGRPIKHIQRHPTLEDDVIVYANATILGGDTVIGAGSTIGGNVFLLASVPPGSMVMYQAPEPKVKAEAKAR